MLEGPCCGFGVRQASETAREGHKSQVGDQGWCDTRLDCMGRDTAPFPIRRPVDSTTTCKRASPTKSLILIRFNLCKLLPLG